ncbi:hypothetical protein AWZ03_000118 [Drosophila navojoa]|uniref:Gamma tubulin complex component protein N-terminal domain-containing protein n=1 Tax=Drosophila navojoa TaxID=7232 RepID=A0A484BX78_DRONA|nr:uncharacterized protein LOC108652285 [Drosophila navojoa]TDG53303.1 hypothetical protein AWZ03_000118 [Drosophila navojoa]
MILEECRELVDRQMPKLVKLLLESEVEDDTYTNCLNSALYCLESYAKPLNTAESISQNLGDFLDRYVCERLEIMAQTIKKLCNVILDDIIITDGFKLALLDFMLSVNFKAFRSARIHYDDYMARGRNVLKALAAAQSTTALYGRRENKLDSYRETLSSKNKSTSTSEEEVLSESTASLHTIRSQDISDNIETLAIGSSSDELYPNQEEEAIDMPPKLNRCSRRFIVAFGSYLRSKFNNAPQCLMEYGEEGFVLREILCMFFLPGDCHFFHMVNHMIDLRPDVISNKETRLYIVEKFLRPLHHMQMMQLYINCSETSKDNTERTETLVCLSAAFRRLLKPIVEVLTYFERSLSNDFELLSLRDLRRATKTRFETLERLWSLAAATYMSYPAEFGNEPHSRSQHIICSLVELTLQTLTARDPEKRAYAAALLLNELQVICRFLDSWWQTGEFNDWYEEFAFKKSERNCRTEYTMRPLDYGQPYMKICRIHRIIRRHIESAGPALAALYDSRRLADFVNEHQELLTRKLHQAVVHSMYEELRFYQVHAQMPVQAGRDIFWQLRTTNDQQLRSLYYAYYVETMSDLKQAEFCNIDELLRRCQNCVIYTPLAELIFQTFERHLEQRALLVNRYVNCLIQNRLHLAKVFEKLRAVYLLFNFNEFDKEYSLAYGYLENGLIVKGAEQLQVIMNRYNSMAMLRNDPFYVALPITNIEQLSLAYSCNKMLNGIITEQQIKSYNEAFRMRLPLYVTVYRVKQLPPLNSDNAVAESLSELQDTVVQALEKHFQIEALQRAVDQLDEILPRSEKLSHLQIAHQEFVSLMVSSLKLGVYRSQHEQQELLTMARIVICLWRRVEYILLYNITEEDTGCDFADKYDDHNMAYFLSVMTATKAMRSLHPLKDIVK